MQNNYSFTITKELESLRLDSAITAYCLENSIELSRSALKAREMPVSVNGRGEKLSFKVREGDKIEFTFIGPKALNATPQPVEFGIVYRDEDIAVINKPYGLTVHPARGHEDRTLVNGLLYYFDQKLPSHGGDERPGIVHRLDKDTAGLMIVALNEKAHHRLTEDFKNRKIGKIYHAVLKGTLDKEGRIEAPIGRSKRDRKKMAVIPAGRPSVTEYHVLEYLKDHSYIEINLLTGRTHQIRVHFSSIGHPVAGDPLYSRGFNQYGLTGIALCSKKLSFTHPVSGRPLNFEIDLPEEMQNLINKLRTEQTPFKIENSINKA